MKIYNFDDDKLEFDFYSTDPPVFRIIVGERPGHTGVFAEAIFRGGHNSHLESVTTWSASEELAFLTLFAELRNRYTTPTEYFDVVPATTDPRAGLRRCEFKRLERGVTREDSEVGFLHLFYADSEGTPWAIVEAEDGQICDAIATTIRFTDIPQTKEADQ